MAVVQQALDTVLKSISTAPTGSIPSSPNPRKAYDFLHMRKLADHSFDMANGCIVCPHPLSQDAQQTVLQNELQGGQVQARLLQQPAQLHVGLVLGPQPLRMGAAQGAGHQRIPQLVCQVRPAGAHAFARCRTKAKACAL
eukprot:scaffold132511_cov16-Tisochrysis_lutea.AAC.2